MCGIYGYYNFLEEKVRDDELLLMANAMLHRGPDGIGHYADNTAGLGNVRLAILDPEGGEQPFFSKDRTVVVVQNGEIFNFKELKKDLEKEGTTFRSKCDTEVILHLYLRDGISFLSKLNGMFAIAILDKNIGKMYVARDRIGEKPLYFCKNNKVLYFASEIKSLPKEFKKTISLDSINAFLRLNYVPAPLTAFKGVNHVMPGCYLEITDSEVAEIRWWDLAERNIDYVKPKNQWIDEFKFLLDDATRLRLVSDVPFGAFLSGGVDSSSVVGLMARHMDRPVKTYSIGFPDPRFDESIYAEQVAQRFKTDHHCKIVDFDIVSEWSDFIYHCDQPHGDVSFMPMKKVSELAAQDVKMVLTGDGADELFAGYEKHVPVLSRPDLSGLSAGDFCREYMPSLSLIDDAGCRELWRQEHHADIDWGLVDRAVEEVLVDVDHFDPINKGLFLDMYFLLPGNNLVKPDRMAMSQSLETRAPFLDYRMMEFAFTMPGDLKLFEGDKKHLYKQAVTPLIGHDLAYRKKQMFTVPIGEWFREQLTLYCNEMLLSEDSKILSLFREDVVAKLISTHIDGKENNTREIRALISIELWLRNFFE
jgi:asparagine synthase (glutamine-hydrolysing)